MIAANTNVMSEMTIKIPEYLRRQVEALASRENISLDRLVSQALASQVTSRLEKNYMEEFAARTGWEKFKAAVYSRPEVEPPTFARP